MGIGRTVLVGLDRRDRPVGPTPGCRSNRF
jgi:hypothetical protein